MSHLPPSPPSRDNVGTIKISRHLKSPLVVRFPCTFYLVRRLSSVFSPRISWLNVTKKKVCSYASGRWEHQKQDRNIPPFQTFSDPRNPSALLLIRHSNHRTGARRLRLFYSHRYCIHRPVMFPAPGDQPKLTTHKRVDDSS